MATRQDSLEALQEPPPPYEPLDVSSPALLSPAAVTQQMETATVASNVSAAGSTASAATSAPRPVNPFLAASETEDSLHHPNNPFVSPSVAARPTLPPRSSTASGATSPGSGIPITSVPGPTASSRPEQSPPPATPVSPSSSFSSSQYRPPAGPPPRRANASSSSTSHPRPQDQYRPTSVPTPGQPLLRKGKLLIYPKNWPGCPKCADTGYKQGDPSNACKKCWDKYGKTYTSAVSYSVGLNDASSHLQKPLPVHGHVGPARPQFAPHASSNYGPVPGGYPAQQMYSPPSSQAGGFAPPFHPPAAHASARPRPPTSPASDDRPDAETEGARMSDVPPNYQDASNVPQDERLPSQYVPPAQPPPGSAGSPNLRPPHHPPPPQHGYPGGYPQPFSPPGPPHNYGPYPQGPPFAGGFSPYAGGPNPHIAVGHYGMRAPPGALVVMPGDPRIGGRLCYECGGRGETESFWFGDETCLRCRGSGRIF